MLPDHWYSHPPGLISDPPFFVFKTEDGMIIDVVELYPKIIRGSNMDEAQLSELTKEHEQVISKFPSRYAWGRVMSTSRDFVAATPEMSGTSDNIMNDKLLIDDF